MQDIAGAITVWRLASDAPAFVTPMAAQPVKVLPQGDEWLYEPKLAGYRALLLKDRNQVQILSRNERDLTRMYPTVTAAGSRLNARQAVIDGEIEPHAAGAPGSRLAGR